MNSIAENVRQIRENIAAACPDADRAVLLVAASKMNDAARVREAVAAGVDACGENRVQELLEKEAQGAYAGCPKHLIGHLQSNKVNKVVGLVELIQSVDSTELLRRIDRRAQSLGIVQDVLAEIAIAGEPQKSGLPPELLPDFLETAAACPGLRVRGLMCIPPAAEKRGENRRYFARMYQLFIDIRGKKYDNSNITMDILSMGMSDDYADAVAEGANMVRVGSAIFGHRQNPMR